MKCTFAFYEFGNSTPELRPAQTGGAFSASTPPCQASTSGFAFASSNSGTDTKKRIPAPISVYHGQWTVPVECTQITPVKETIIPATTGQAAPRLTTTESTIPPSNAPLVNPTKLNAAFITEVISRLRNATTTSIPPQKTVAQRLNRRPVASSFVFPTKPRSCLLYTSPSPRD